MTVPNLISIFRIVLVGVFCVCYFTPGMMSVAFAVLLLSGFSDIADGYVARKFNQVSNIGKVLDPIADRLFQFSTIICFWISDVIDLWLVIIIFSRELFTAIGGIFFYNKNRTVIAAKWYGKLASACFFLTFLSVFFFEIFHVIPENISKIIITSLFILSVSLALFSTIKYIVVAYKIHKVNKKSSHQVIEDKSDEEGRQAV